MYNPTASEATIRGMDFSFSESLPGNTGFIDLYKEPSGVEIRMSISEEGLPTDATFHWPGVPEKSITIINEDGASLDPDYYEVLAYELLDDNPAFLERLTSSEPEEVPSPG